MSTRGPERVGRWRRGALTGAFALALAAPGPVYPCTMDRLLSLPLDCLLRLEFTPPGAPLRAGGCGATVPCIATDREAR